MPKLYEYFGLVVLFYDHDHEPMHVHGKYQGTESKAELIIKNGEIVDIRIKNVQGKRPLNAASMKRFKKIVEVYQNDIMENWINFFVLNKKVTSRTPYPSQ